jgi:hypothetical protein
MKLDQSFESEIIEIVELVRIFKKSCNRSDTTFLDIGTLLVDMKNKKNLDEVFFKKLVVKISKLIGRNGLRNLNKAISVAQSDIIQKNREKLPKDWTVLFFLSKQENLSNMIESGVLKNDMPLAVIKKRTKDYKRTV